MSATITIRDESASGKTLNEFSLEMPSERTTVRELIRSRVYQEVKDFNAAQARGRTDEFPGLVQPTTTEATLNETAKRKPKSVDWQRQFERALAAFRANQILVLVDDRQTESLDEEITLASTTSVSFLRLTLLTGG